MQMYALGVLALAAEQVILQIYYGLSDTRTPTAIGIAAFGVQIATVWAGVTLLSGAIKHDPAVGFRVVAGGYAFAKTAKIAVLLALLPVLHKGVIRGRAAEGVRFLVRLAGAVATMAVAVQALLRWSLATFHDGGASLAATLHLPEHGAEVLSRLLVVGLPTAGGVIVFFAVAALLRIEETARMWSVIRQVARRSRRQAD
jgi:peptidoglycan biosynthesis protein MviN/MurJ (putative lipid II flippase)